VLLCSYPLVGSSTTGQEIASLMAVARYWKAAAGCFRRLHASKANSRECLEAWSSPMAWQWKCLGYDGVQTDMHMQGHQHVVATGGVTLTLLVLGVQVEGDAT
jgi:hypothetical protein